MPSSTLHGLCLSAALLLPASTALWAADATTAGTATATAPSSTWIAFAAPFTGDDDRDGWTVFELGLAPGGPFDVAEVWKIPGPPEWRAETFRGLAADTDYYVQVTFVDPDGVSGSNPQVVGPVRTLASAPDAVTLGTATASVGDAEILLSQPISGDANGNSLGIVELATDPGGPWTERCGSPSENRLPYHPRRCRLRSLTPGTDYWVRIDNSDPDGVSGTDPQLLGPIPYTGRANLAAGRPITADPGWGCCPNPALLVDGRIQYRFWPFGFAWTGGTTGYGGGPAGWKQATIDLGAGSIFDRVEVWLHGPNSPPTDWRLETSDDGASWSEVWATTDPQCRGAAEQLSGTSWQHPNCSQGASFAPVTARYLRYWFDDRTLFGGLHGWAVELEVLAPPPPDTTAPTDPTAVASTTHTPSSWSLLQEITVEWSGAADTGFSGLAGYSVLFDTSPATLPDDTVDVAHTADPHATTSAALADGQAHYFHLRTCDNAGNCSSTAHLGPFWVDATDPSDPTDVQSTSHTVGVASALDVVAMSWTAGVDASSGLDGYAWAFTGTSDPVCDETKDLEETATSVSSPALAEGSWWFHICTVDNVGNWTSTVTAGPYVIDPNDPPVAVDDAYATLQDTPLSVAGPQAIADWRFDDGAGLTAGDSSGNGHDGTVFGAAWSAGKVAGALSFDGLDDSVWIDHHDFINSTNDFTYTVWVNPGELITGGGAGKTMIVSLHDGPYLYFDRENGRLVSWVAISGGRRTIESTTDSWQSGVWYHVAVTFSGSAMKLYVDGQLETDIAGGTRGPGGDGLHIRFGRSHWKSDFYLLGVLDELAFYGRELTAGEIEQDYLNSGPGVLANDTDGDGDALTAALEDDVSHGILSLAADGSFSYQPETRWHGEDSFTYRASDGAADSNLATVTITVEEATLQSIDVLPADPPLSLGQMQQFTARGSFDNGSVRDLEPGAGAWVSHAPMPTPRAWLDVVSVGGLLYAVGGNAGGSAVSTVEAYDPAGNSWSAIASTPTARYETGVAALDGLLYAVGGCAGVCATNVLATMDVYDPATGAWTARAPMPTARFDLGVATIAGILYAVGGQNGPQTVTYQTLEAYDPATDSWTTLAPLPTARREFAAAAVDGILYVAGGWIGGPVSVVEAYDPATDTWSTRAPLPVALGAASAAGLDGELYVLGGYTGSVQSAVWAYDPALDSWQSAPSMPTARNALGSGVVGGSMYAVGGCAACFPALGTTESLDPGEMSWSSGTPAVATIDVNGLATAVGLGSSTITATSGAISGGTTLTATDSAAPTDPTTAQSSSHAPGVWSAVSAVSVEWSGAGDTGGSGLAGYSVLFDTSPSTLPDDTVEVAHAADPHATTSAALADGQAHYFHLRTCDNAGNCSSTAHLGPFWVDATDPSDPTDVQSTSHTVGVASALDVVAMSWTAGVDASSGLDGYAWAFTGTSDPVCDETKDLEETATSVSSPALAEGSWWFHICTVDNVGNWTSTVTAGPYLIDTAPPNDPTTVQSTSHTPSTWSGNTQIAVQWSGATDEGSAGVAGYSVLFDTSPATLPDATIDVAHTADPHDTTSSPLSDGQSHWFHLRTCDGADNCTATTHLGPFWIDTVPPEVGLVATVADTGDGVLSEAEVSGVPVTQLLVTFDEQVVGAADTANFLLLRDGGDGFQTLSCAAGADPGDEVMALDTASYSAAALTSTLGVHGGIPLLDGDYRLFACASPSISDLAGNALDGNGNGTGGDDFTRSFTLLDTRPTAHPGADRTIDVDEGINLGSFPAATGGTPPYAYLWTVTPDAAVDLSSTTEAHPTLSCATPEILTAELTVSDVSGLESPATAAEITVICPPRRDLYNADYFDIRLFEATELITAEEVVIRTGANVSFKAGESVILLDGFEVETDAVLRILIEPATDCF